MWVDRALVALLVLSAPATAQTSKDRARAITGEPAKAAQRLTLTDIPVPTSKPTALFDGRTLEGWAPWLGYADPSTTYQSKPGTPPVGTSRDTSGDFAVRAVDGAPAIWVKGETWGSLVNTADLGD